MSASALSVGFDPESAARFSARMLDVLNHGALGMMLSIGHRTGLLDAMRGLPMSDSSRIAAHAGLDERYVREWLGAMATAGVVDVDPRRAAFQLPDEHAQALTRDAGSDNIAVFMQYIAVLGAVEDEIVHCFRTGGGVPYAHYPRFHAVMAEDSALSVLSSLQDQILPLVPGLHERLLSGIHVLDLGCGSGRILISLAALYPASHFVGLDLCADVIARASQDASDAGLRNLHFQVMDLGDFDQTAPAEAYDLVTTFDAIHDQAHPLAVLRGIHRTLRQDGIYLMQDIAGSGDIHGDLDHPIGTFLYTISCMHCMSVSLAQHGEGLGAMWGDRVARDYLRKAGFAAVDAHHLAHDIQNTWYVIHKEFPALPPPAMGNTMTANGMAG